MHKWFPWRWVVTRLARSQGFLDPLSLYARLSRFAQPSEVAEPVELLRAGAVFHARGLLNARVLQHNLDWVWPYWVERQFDPADVSFITRAFSLTHINLTHRNWTAFGLPGRLALPIVDPRGLLTPFWDSWSLDVWLLDDQGHSLLPSRELNAVQWQTQAETLCVHTRVASQSMCLDSTCSMVSTDAADVVRLQTTGTADVAGWLVISLRPCNPEGVSFVDDVKFDRTSNSWLVNERDIVNFDAKVDKHYASDYGEADVFINLCERVQSDSSECRVGMATAAAMFRIESDSSRTLQVDIPVRQIQAKPNLKAKGRAKISTLSNLSDSQWPQESWDLALRDSAALDIPDPHMKSLYDAAVQTLILCTPDDCHAGPYTYKRFWYRDAVFIGHGLLSAGLVGRARHLISRFPKRQSLTGYYHSQEGEWDANGEVLWLADRFRQMTGELPSAALWSSLKLGADWIDDKRLPEGTGLVHEGLLPAGFSAEHLGPNDHYYWDNYWSLAGLRSAANLAAVQGLDDLSQHYIERADALHVAIERSLAHLPGVPGCNAIPAAPSRRMDAGAIGSIVVSYPLQLCKPDDEQLSGTVQYLLNHCFHKNGFFQDMIHSGVNVYLTLQIAQVLLRSEDSRYADLVREVAALASPTGHWPEAVHPHTFGGCMGDGHHAWAAAEWVAMIRTMFMREEAETLILASGILPEWLNTPDALSFGHAPTLFGLLRVQVSPVNQDINVWEIRWEASWHTSAPQICICLPGFERVDVESSSNLESVRVRRVDT